MPIQTFRKRINNEKMRFRLPSGTGIKLKYMLNIHDDGCECLECIGQHDLYAEIQSYRENCDLSLLLRNIDPMQLNNMMSTYSVDDLINSGFVDYSHNPTTLGGLFNLVKEGENLFNGLPEEVRREFNYSVKNFVSKFGSPEFSDVINKYIISQNPNVQSQSSNPVSEPTPQQEPTSQNSKKGSVNDE
ncbi:MAG: hypothetical protein ACI4SR_08510 [Faecalibacillus sp.]